MTKDRIRRHPAVQELWSEHDGLRDDGRPAWWVGLHPGYCCPPMECHTIHEATVKEAWGMVREVTRCRCIECIKAVPGWRGGGDTEECRCATATPLKGDRVRITRSTMARDADEFRRLLADGADEVHQWRIAQRAIDAYKKDGTTTAATGNLPL